MPTRTPTQPASYTARARGQVAPPHDAAIAHPESRGAVLRLAAYSLLILFFELAFIRYTAGQVRLFGYYLNFVLIAAFLGMGVGLLRADAARRLKWLAVPASLLLIAAVRYLSGARVIVPGGASEHFWSVFLDGTAGRRGIPLLWAVIALFTLLTMFFVPLGALMGAEFRKLPPLRAYSVDIAGSLLGIIAFAALSAARQPPVVWLAIGFGAWVLASLDDWRFAAALGIAAAGATLGVTPRGDAPEYWSPYYRIGVTPTPWGANVTVNGAMHQVMLNLDPAHAARDVRTAVARAGYLQPYRFAARVDTALVVGAGTGNDLALLLQLGAKHIDAVEIDPVIIDLGRVAHPQQPYGDQRVHPHVDDARAFLRRTDEHYDVIIFGTLDSQTLLSGMSSVRLDNYVYTVESFRSARDRLKPDGTLIVYHMSGNPHIAAKIYQMIGEAFGEPPRAIGGYYLLFNHTFVAGHGARGAPPPDPALGLTAPVTQPRDDWPYLYLDGPSLPAHYAVALVAVLLIAIGLLAAAGGKRVLHGGVDGAMLLMGVGFLLVETKSVTEMSLLFGSTWKVNLLVFSSILVTVLVANLVVLRSRSVSTRWLFGGLLASLAGAYAVPASRLLWFGPAGQWVLGSLLVALPVLFASLIFSTLLRRRVDATRALAYNLLGAVVGGLLEYSSMAGGIKLLYVVAAAAYVGAAVFALREGSRTPPPDVEVGRAMGAGLSSTHATS
jgi:SAM-dependent methyltransferase